MINALIATGIIQDFRPRPLPLPEIRRRLHEYELIANKKSSLSSMKRQQIVRWVESNYKGGDK